MRKPNPPIAPSVYENSGAPVEEASPEQGIPFRVAAESLPIGIVVTDKDGVHTYVNLKFSEIFGYTLDEVPNTRVFLEMILPNKAHRTRVLSAWLDKSKNFSPDKQKGNQFQITSKDGASKMVRFVFHPFRAGESFFTCEDVTSLVQTEKALERSEKRRKLVFEKSVDPMIIFNDHGALDCNEAMLRLLCLASKKELETRDFLDFLPDFQPDGRRATQLAHEIVQKTLREGKGRVECLVHPARGDEIWVDMSLSRIVLSEGRTAIYSVWRDVTERKRMEEQAVQRADGMHTPVKDAAECNTTEDALKESERRARRIFNNIPLPVFVVDFDGMSIIDVNKNAVNHYGYGRDEFLSMNISDLMQARNDLTSHTPAGATVRPEKGLGKHRKKDGTIIDVEVISEPLHMPGKEYTILIVNDISEKRKAEEALKFTQFAVDHAAVGIIWIGKDGHILYANDEICRSLEYSREELLTMMAHDISPSYPAHSWEIIWKNVKRLGSATVQTIYKSKAEKVFPVELTANYMDYDGDGYVCAIVRDVTESKRAEEALSRREGELKVESSRLAEANTALKVLLKHREEDRLELENRFMSNIKQLVFPYMDKLKSSHLNITQLSCLEIIETNLNDIISPFLQKMSVHFSNFTPTEIQIADLIKIGKTTKEIAAFMKVSTGTVDTHRNNIRSKLGLNNKKMNLRTFLLSLV